MLADVIIFVYEVPCIFWRYINVDEVSLITLEKLLQSVMELLQIATVHPTVSAPDKSLCCKPTNIGKNDIMYILNFVCTGFIFSFHRSVPSILSFQLIQIFF